MSKFLLLALTVAASSLLGCTAEDADEPEPPARSEPIDHWFSASDGIKLHYVEYAGTGSPVVLVHGFLGSSEGNWIAPGISSAIAARHRVVLLDQRGHGESDKPKDAAAYGERMLTDVIELLDHLDVPRAHIGGYSMGGAITLGLMKRAPGEDRRCVRLEMTEAGRKEVAPYLSELERLESEVRKHLTAQEAKTLRHLLEKLQTGLQQIEASSAEEEEEK